jgi:hypothetical protein
MMIKMYGFLAFVDNIYILESPLVSKPVNVRGARVTSGGFSRFRNNNNDETNNPNSRGNLGVGRGGGFSSNYCQFVFHD